MKQTMARQLDLIRYLERGAVHLAASMGTPQEAACEPEADERWCTRSGIVYTFDFDGWSANLHFDSDRRFSHDTIDFFGHCDLPGFARIARPSEVACTVKGTVSFDLGDEQVALLRSGATVHFRKEEGDVRVLTKIAGALLPYYALANYYRLMLRC
ncbi:hypothetical protein G6K88_25375 [Agrobacterium rhizogenes]|uniref:hypothetical protein n=1 Tax=Rhizobium rhizogenes TaxID=359 RepID=UPI001AEEC70B|nr:hypothetical protein [Rhizobium rhizogenes]NTI05361.1 hypothetical protein [Rhizobium rhizogenes]NTI12171.1 hypothetical protein [Rhizobium rhizogenes]